MARPILLVISVITGIYSTINGQSNTMEWAPLGATWYYDFTYYATPRVDYLKMTSVKDTVVNGKQARFIEGVLHTHSGYEIPASQEYSDGNIIIHQNGDSIFYLRENKFELLYDFSLGKGDTMDIVTPGKYRPGYSDSLIQVTIDSVGTINLEGKVLRTQHVKINREKYKSSYIFRGRIIEKIGIETYFLPYDDLICDISCPNPLRCYVDSVTAYKQKDEACDSTWLGTPTENPSTQPDLLIYPNPLLSGSTELNIEIRSDRWSWLLKDLQGRTIAQSKIYAANNTSFILPSSLQPGMYILEIRSAGKYLVKKLMVQ